MVDDDEKKATSFPDDDTFGDENFELDDALLSDTESPEHTEEVSSLLEAQSFDEAETDMEEDEPKAPTGVSGLGDGLKLAEEEEVSEEEPQITADSLFLGEERDLDEDLDAEDDADDDEEHEEEDEEEEEDPIALLPPSDDFEDTMDSETEEAQSEEAEPSDNDIFESFDDEDDPFELTDDDEAFSEDDDDESALADDGKPDGRPSFAGLGASGGPPIKVIAGVAGALAVAFIGWQVLAGGSDDSAVSASITDSTAVSDDMPAHAVKPKHAGFGQMADNDLHRPTPPEMHSSPEDDLIAQGAEGMSVEPAQNMMLGPEGMLTHTASAEPAAPPVPVVAEVDLKPIEALLSEYNEVLTARMRRVESSLRSVSDDLDDINRNLGSVNDQVNGMGYKVTNMSDQFKMLGESQETDRSEMARQEMFNNPSLHVHAIIPGRAWLKKHDGGIITVSEGDLLGEYGKVLAIDPSSAAVITSSGVTLR